MFSRRLFKGYTSLFLGGGALYLKKKKEYVLGISVDCQPKEIPLLGQTPLSFLRLAGTR